MLAAIFGLPFGAGAMAVTYIWLGSVWADFASMVAFVFSYFRSAVAYGVLTEKAVPKQFDAETRCRKCGHILRGLTEPRRPECGEQI